MVHTLSVILFFSIILPSDSVNFESKNSTAIFLNPPQPYTLQPARENTHTLPSDSLNQSSYSSTVHHTTCSSRRRRGEGTRRREGISSKYSIIFKLPSSLISKSSTSTSLSLKPANLSP
ncbi:hypothetical protein BY996DRAFT_3991493 [Phakopsora pachyrhizi]|nr:hypothetical protein BY996DRAFT_3991493 [Phakopsora pachyrhizi]